MRFHALNAEFRFPNLISLSVIRTSVFMVIMHFTAFPKCAETKKFYQKEGVEPTDLDNNRIK
jgi:hypothetical protein